jgi:hypothetical protein
MATLWQLRMLSEVIVRANWMTRRKDGTINRWLADALEQKVPANPKPVHGVSSMDVPIDAPAGTWARLFIPVQARTLLPINPSPRLTIHSLIHPTNRSYLKSLCS